MSTILGHGAYTFREAARLTRLPEKRIREWFRRQPIFRGDYASVDGQHAISFHDLIDVFVAGTLREHGVSMQTVRKVYLRLAADLGVNHPFCRQELLSDGKSVFMHSVDAKGNQALADVLTKQGVFSQIMLPFLKTIRYDEVDLLARKWQISSGVVIDPQICFGAPVVESTGIPTSILAKAFAANAGNVNLVANWYGIEPKDVKAAARFERSLAA